MTKKVIGAVVALVMIATILAFLNAGDREERVMSQRDAKIFIKVDDEQIDTVSFDDILKLEQFEFEATLRSSNSPDKENIYKGVRLRDLLESSNVSLDEINQVITKAADGYTVALSADEVLDEDNVYIVYEINGTPLTPKEEGGSGPYQIVIKQDQFGQRWNKFLMELNIR